MFGHRNTFEKAVETIFNNIEPTWQQEFRFANPFINNVTGIKTAPINLLFVFVSIYK